MVTLKSSKMVGINGKSIRPIVILKVMVPISLGLDVERVIVVPEIVRNALVGDNV